MLGSVDLIVGTKCDKEALVACPAEEHTKVLIDAEHPILAQLAFELVSPQQPVVRVGREAAQRGAQEFIPRWPQLRCSAQKARRGDDAHGAVASARWAWSAKLIE